MQRKLGVLEVPENAYYGVQTLADKLLEKLEILILALESKAQEFDGIIKMGRTQLEDTVPIRLGQEFQAYTSALNYKY